MFIDSHAHLDVPNYDADRAEVIARARAAGVELMLEIAGSDIGKGSLEPGLRLANEHEFIYAAIGLHPHEASLYNTQLEKTLLDCSRHPKVIGWGEIGLDYHYDHSPRDVQQQVFQRQLELAIERRLPVIIHTREAEEDTIAILRQAWAENGGADIGGIIHCFTSSQALADAALEMGFYISFSGILTFKNAEALREVARQVPLDRLLVETDSPYLAPVPHRGKDNQPAFVRYVAETLASVRGIDYPDLVEATTSNFFKLFSHALP